MTTLLLSTLALPAAPALAQAARRRGWGVTTLNDAPASLAVGDDVVFYGSTLDAMDVAYRFQIALLEPSLDLPARIPRSLLLRHVEYRIWAEVHRLPHPLFLKPADALEKVFDAGVYRDLAQIRTHRPLPPTTPVLISEPVEWLYEYRCFVLNKKIVAVSPYLTFGRPLFHHPGESFTAVVPAPVAAVCDRLVRAVELPPAFVVDIGLIEDRGWAVVEFNPCWCSGLLSADPARVLNVLRRACRPCHRVATRDRRWIAHRPPPEF